MLVSAIIAPVQALLVDPNGIGWPVTTTLIPYLNAFMLDLSGKRRDIYSQRQVVNLVAGGYQQVPSGGIQLLDTYFAANGQAVFIINMQDRLNSRFQAAMTEAPNVNPQFVTVDPRDRKGFRVFPPAPNPPTGATLDLLYAATPPLVAAMTDTYPLDPDTYSPAQWYVIGMAYDTNTEHRDTVKSKEYMARYDNWVQSTLGAQAMDQPDSP